MKISRRLRYLLLRLNITRLITFGYRSEVPERNILIGYIVYMLLGFLCLMLPLSTNGDIRWIDNLFTAASAISTTGLATVDIGTSYTLFGQFIILALVQFGGIGYMTLSSYVIYRVTHHTLKYTDKVVHTAISIPYGMNMRDLVNNVVNFTFIFEALGFIPFFIALHHAGAPMPGWNALFLSVSSFCTAGFSPFHDSLCSFSNNITINITVAALSYAGAMGFIVITDLTNKLRGRTTSLSFTSKVILLITGIMTVGGTVILSVSPSIAPGDSAGEKIWLSFFQTMSAITTVGYNTIDLSALRPGPILMFSLIMFIAVIASMTQLVEMAVEKYSPALYSSLGIFLPLIAVNCAILGGSLFMQQRDFPSIWTAVCAGGGWGLGGLLAITAIAAIRERLAVYSNIPRPLRGVGITFIITALMGIAFMSFLGIKI